MLLKVSDSARKEEICGMVTREEKSP